MQAIKRISIVLIFLFLFIGISSASEVNNRNITSYTFSYYMKFLDIVLVPDLQKYINNFNLIPYNSKVGDQFLNGIFRVIIKHGAQKNILILPTKVKIRLLRKPRNNGIVIYVVNIILPLIEYNTLQNALSYLIISKDFFCAKEIVAPKENI